MSRRLILITGIPGTGKTTTGDCLRDDYGFQHVDIEDLESAQTRAFSMNASNFIQAATGDLVVTWGFRPLQDLVSVIQLREHLGFFPVWFDGDRAAALRHFNLRPTGLPESEFHMQIHNITVKDVVNTLRRHRSILSRPTESSVQRSPLQLNFWIYLIGNGEIQDSLDRVLENP